MAYLRMTPRRLRLLSSALALLMLVISGCQPEPESGIQFLNKASSQHIRVLSFNVGWDSIFPVNDPQNHEWRQDNAQAAFLRILKAVEPDILCLQEINPFRDPRQVASILDEALPLPSGEKWQAHRGLDNVIATRFHLRMEGEETIQSAGLTNFGHGMALVDLPDAEYKQDIYLICAHFKSAGGLANIQARQVHADAIIAWIGDIQAPGGKIDLPPGTPIVVLGDLNVYDTDPAHHLATLINGDIKDEGKYGGDISPDWDNTTLADALPRHNGVGAETYTWRDDTQEFNPGELDRILYTDSVLHVENAFVLDTTIMTEGELKSTGLEAGDVALDLVTGRYDHLPLVVDISFQELSSGQ